MVITSVQEQFSHFRTGGRVHFRRFSMQLPISVKAESSRVRHQCESSNVSTRGIYFDFPEPVDVGCRLEILMTIPGGVTKGEAILVRLFATAVRVDHRGSSRGPVGIAAAIERFDFGEETPAEPNFGEEERLHQEQPMVRRFRVDLVDPAADLQKVDDFFTAFLEAKRAAGEKTDNMSADTFKRFVHKKTAQLKRDFGCQQVEYVIEVAHGQVKLKAKVV